MLIDIATSRRPNEKPLDHSTNEQPMAKRGIVKTYIRRLYSWRLHHAVYLSLEPDVRLYRQVKNGATTVGNRLTCASYNALFCQAM